MYRLVIFSAIVLLVYHFTFKALGILLFFLEVWLLLLQPLFRELAEWRRLDPEYVSGTRTWTSGAVVSASVLVLFLPLSSTVRIPAVVQPADLSQVYPPRSARIVKIEARRNQMLSAGDPIIRLEVPELGGDIEAAQIELDQVRLKLNRGAADARDRSETIILARELAQKNTMLAGLESMDRELVIRAPVSGRLVQLENDLHHGRWVKQETLLALVSSEKKFVANGYISEDEIDRLYTRGRGKFIPDDLSRSSLEVNLIDVAIAGEKSIGIPELADVNGGQIATIEDNAGNLTAISPQYAVKFELLEHTQVPNQIIRGTIHFHGTHQSIAGKLWERVARILVRESVF